MATVRRYGFRQYLSMERGRMAMERSARRIREIERGGGQVYTVYFLTGKKYWPQTALCLYSLQRVSGAAQVNAVFIDDGTLSSALVRQISRQFPHSRIKTAKEINANLERCLPEQRYPLIRKKRLSYPHLRKLTDVHGGGTGWKLTLDSDMLFFKYPGAMMDWLSQPGPPFFLKDPFYAYHYTPGLMEALAGQPVVQGLNAGMVGLSSGAIDWDKLERWIAALEEKEGPSYLLEQALSAMLAAGQSITVAPAREYLVMPGEQEASEPEAALHHYVAGSKLWYYKKSWRLVV